MKFKIDNIECLKPTVSRQEKNTWNDWLSYCIAPKEIPNYDPVEIFSNAERSPL